MFRLVLSIVPIGENGYVDQRIKDRCYLMALVEMDVSEVMLGQISK